MVKNNHWEPYVRHLNVTNDRTRGHQERPRLLVGCVGGGQGHRLPSSRRLYQELVGAGDDGSLKQSNESKENQM